MPPECRRSLPPRPAGRIQHPASSMLPLTRERRLSRSGHSSTSVAPPATRDTCLRHASVQPWHALSPPPSSGTQDFRILSDERAEQLRAKVRGRVNPNPHPNPNPNPNPHPHPHPNPYPYPNPNPNPKQREKWYGTEYAELALLPAREADGRQAVWIPSGEDYLVRVRVRVGVGVRVRVTVTVTIRVRVMRKGLG